MAKSQRRKGVSRQIKQTIVDSSSSAASSMIKVKVLKQQAIVKEREAAKKRIHDSLIGVGGHTLKQLQEMRVNSGIFEDFPQDLYQDASMCELQDVGNAMEVDGVLNDGESLVHVLRDLLKKLGNLCYKYRDACTWQQHLEKADTYWTLVLDEVVSSYLRWKHPSRPSDSPPMPTSTSSCTHEGADPLSFGPRGNPPSAEPSASSSACMGVITNPSDFVLPPPPLPGSPQPCHEAMLWSTASSPRGVAMDVHKEPMCMHATHANDPVSSGSLEGMPPPREDHTDTSCNRDTLYSFSIDVVDIYTLQTMVTISCTGSQTAVVALAEQGYMDKVKHTPQALAQTPGSDSKDDNWIDEGEATATDFEGTDDVLCKCMQNWKAVENDTKKKMWGIFDETGIFASCTFGGTISQSFLGPEFCHLCQMKHHPSVIAGTRIEDLRGMERIFSSSNQLALVIRYASKYLRHLLIDMYFKQWDEDKYLNLGTMHLQNYRQVIEIIQDKTPILQENLHNLGCTLDDFANEESLWDVHAIEYVSLLRRLRELEDRSQSNMDVFMTSIPDDYTFTPPDPTASKPSAGYYADALATKRQETEQCAVCEEIQDLQHEVITLELHMGISTHWQPHSQEYIDTIQYIHERDYHVALDNVQCLVIQWLFELHTMNLSQTGIRTAYKVWMHIAKNLQCQSKAICTAIRTYNKVVLALDLPHLTLDWSKITHYAFIEEFELLHDT
ncbi:hypothetical protein C8Q78DRAFT_992613 [Trametes maxima]|nr:hypothetical protein C8Q78DRAFT_992613 [Trametes maxima]